MDISTLTALESSWDTISVWLAGCVAIAVILESVAEFEILAKLLRLKNEKRKKQVAKCGLGFLIVALVCEVGAAMKSHSISEQVTHGLNTEIREDQTREEQLVEQTKALGLSNRSLTSELADQDAQLRSLQSRSVTFEKAAQEQKARDDAALGLLNAEEVKLNAAQKSAGDSSLKAQKAATAADEAASGMQRALYAENEMREQMHNLVTPRSM